MSDLETVRTVVLDICGLCLHGSGGECHTPGCVLWMNRAPDNAISDHPSFRIADDSTGQAVARVRELHSPEDRGHGEPVCKGCDTSVTFAYWPCATIRALDGIEGGSDDE